jgi:prevent-host-death family protein
MAGSIIVSALDARSKFGKLLQRLDTEGRSVVIEKRGTPRAVLVSIQNYVRLAAPEPEILRAIGAESVQKATNTLSSKRIDQIIREARKKKSKRG